MSQRLASVHDRNQRSDEAKPKPSLNGSVEQDAKVSLGIPGRFIIGDLIRARASPSIQGVVLGKTKGREAVRVLLAPYASGSIPVAAVIIDIPAAIIPPQGCPIAYGFWNPVAVQNYVHYLATKGPIKREQENLLVSWVNNKQYPEDSVFSAASELSVAEIASPGLVKARVRDCEKAARHISPSAAESSSLSVPEVWVSSAGPIEKDMPETRSRSTDVKERVGDTSVSSTPSESLPSTFYSDITQNMAPAPATDSTLQHQFQQFSADMKQQFKELTELVSGVARRQKMVEDKLAESTSSHAAQWEELDLRLNAATQRPESSNERSRVKERQVAQSTEDGDPEWLLRGNRKDDSDWQVPSRQVGRALTDPVEESLECPFSIQSRRNDGFRVARSHRRAHRRMLEEVYGANDSAVASAYQLVGQLDKDTRAPTWEVAMLLQVAKGLDIVLLEHEDGMWTQWNQPIVDFMASFYFEMVARVRPDEDVVQLMQPDLQKKLRELNFGKQRAFGPVTAVNRQNKNWRSTGYSDPSKPFQKEGGAFQRKNQWGNNEKPLDGGNTQTEFAAGQGTWTWSPGINGGKLPQSFRPEAPPYPPAPPPPRPPQ